MPGRHNAVRSFDPSTLSPRVRMALRLYGTGAVPTLVEASRTAGLNDNALYFRRYHDKRMDIYLHQLDKEIHEGSIDMTKVLQRLGRQAVVNIAHLADSAQKEDVRLRANQDLADRSPETAKTHKL